LKPEEEAREQIDDQLQAAGWTVQSRDAANLGAARGVAVAEFPLATGFADYMLFVDRRSSPPACGPRRSRRSRTSSAPLPSTGHAR